MSGKLKKALAILAALGITASGVVEFLTHVMSVFPANKYVHAICTAVVTIIGLAVSIYPVSIKLPDDSPDKKPAMPPAGK